ncbi:MAG: hypothetical protein WCS52_02765 [bacterium]
MRRNRVFEIAVCGLCGGWLAIGEVTAGDRPEAADSNIVLSLLAPAGGAIRLQIDYPTTFSNRLDIYVSTNLQSGRWGLREAGLPAAGSPALVWTDLTNPDARLCFYQAGNADLDTDQDGLADARETLIYQTDPQSPDSDSDGVPDGAEISRGTDPLSGGSSVIMLYADSDAGADGYDGYAPLVSGGHGPKRSLRAASEASYSHDVIQLSGVTLFDEPALVLGIHDVTVCPLGSVRVQP